MVCHGISLGNEHSRPGWRCWLWSPPGPWLTTACHCCPLISIMERVTFESDTLKSVIVHQMGTDNNNNKISWLPGIVKVFVVKPMWKSKPSKLTVRAIYLYSRPALQTALTVGGLGNTRLELSVTLAESTEKITKNRNGLMLISERIKERSLFCSYPWYWGQGQEPCTCQAGTLAPRYPWLSFKFIFFLLVFWDRVSL